MHILWKILIAIIIIYAIYYSYNSYEHMTPELSQALYDLIAQQPFFKGTNSHQLQLLTDSALEMTALN